MTSARKKRYQKIEGASGHRLRPSDWYSLADGSGNGNRHWRRKQGELRDSPVAIRRLVEITFGRRRSRLSNALQGHQQLGPPELAARVIDCRIRAIARSRKGQANWSNWDEVKK
jgi:hypothetical protein